MSVSHPRSGLNWYRHMLYEVLRRWSDDLRPGGEFENPWMNRTHDRMGMRSLKAPALRGLLARQKSPYASYKICFLARDPRDMLVSNWHRIAPRGADLAGCSVGEFFRHSLLGILPACRWLQWWSKHRHQHRGFEIFYYEDTLQNPMAALQRMVRFTCQDRIPDHVLEEAVRASTFVAMKRKEQRQGRLFADLKPALDGKPGTAIVRKGMAGEWRRELDAGTKMYAMAAMARYLTGTPFSRYVGESQ
jgi:hypothetical protein